MSTEADNDYLFKDIDIDKIMAWLKSQEPNDVIDYLEKQMTVYGDEYNRLGEEGFERLYKADEIISWNKSQLVLHGFEPEMIDGVEWYRYKNLYVVPVHVEEPEPFGEPGFVLLYTLKNPGKAKNVKMRVSKFYPFHDFHLEIKQGFVNVIEKLIKKHAA